MDRRDFIVAGSAAASALAVQKAVAAADNCSGDVLPASGALNRAQFEQWLNTDFRVIGAEQRSTMRLTRLVADRDTAELEQFHVYFEGAVDSPAGLCRVRHRDGAEFALHLESVGDNGRAGARRATFSLLTGR